MNAIYVAMLVLNAGGGTDVRVERLQGWNSLVLGGTAFHRTQSGVEGLNSLQLPNSRVKVVTWDEVANGATSHYSAVSLNGSRVDRVVEDSREIKLRFGSFDPVVRVLPVDQRLKADSSNGMFIVQFVSQPLPEYRDAIKGLGGDVQNYLPDNAYVVEAAPALADKIRALPFVRWVGALEPQWRLDENVTRALLKGTLTTDNYYVQVSGDSVAHKAVVTDKIRAVGGTIVDSPKEGSILEVQLKPELVAKVVAVDGVLFMDHKGEREADMNNVRVVNGADYLKTVAGYDGTGLNAHVIDGGFRQTHQDFAGHVTVRNNSSDTSHGSSTTGIVFGAGVANPTGKGMLPKAQGVFSVYTVNWAGAARLAWTQDTVNTYKCVIESNSWGDTLTGSYTTISSYMDEIIYKTDLLICQSMSNWGNNTQVRPQAWAKNIVSIGGVYHFDNQNLADDRWSSGASIGPAADGRQKPELCFYYDSIFCPTNTSDTAYTTGFNGTSSATPMSAGCFGLYYQMWANGEFGNSCLGTTVFENRSHAATAKAVVVNNAKTYSNTQLDIERKIQGWGLPNVQNIYDSRNVTRVVDGTDYLQNLQEKTYNAYVLPGTPSLKVTMAYTDYWAAANANPTRVNQVSVRVMDPNGQVYYGNNGMLVAVDAPNVTSPGGAPDPLNNLQNVWVNNPIAGVWKVIVKAEALAQDRIPSTPEMDTDFGLCINGALYGISPNSATAYKPGSIRSGGLAELIKSDNAKMTFQTPLTTGGGGIVQSGVTCLFTMPNGAAAPQGLRFITEPQTNLGAIPYKALLWNFTTNGFDTVYSGNAPLTKSVVNVDVPGGMANYIDANGNIRAAFIFERNTSLPAAQVWLSQLDHVRCVPQY